MAVIHQSKYIYKRNYNILNYNINEKSFDSEVRSRISNSLNFRLKNLSNISNSKIY